MEQIYPPGRPRAADTGGDAREAAADLLAGLYAYPAGAAPGRPWVRANMIASADGSAVIDGRSGGLGGPADRMLFGVLRALADVILVGAGTATAERYGPARPAAGLAALRQGRPVTPPIAVISARLTLDPRAPLLTRAPADARTIVLTTPAAPPARRSALARHAEVIVAEPGQVTAGLLTAGQAIGALGALGHARILVEGGPSLLAQIAAEGLLDELCLTISPVLAGGRGPRILSGAPDAPQPGHLGQLRLAHVLVDDDFLFCRYRRAV